MVLQNGEIMTNQIKIKDGISNVFVSLLQNKILLSIYAHNGSMSVHVTKDEAKQIIDALEITQNQIHEQPV
jgi:hypothetical protein